MAHDQDAGESSTTRLPFGIFRNVQYLLITKFTGIDTKIEIALAQ